MTIENIFPDSDVEALRGLLDNAKRVAITCHISPDGDALGSSLALAYVLRHMGKTAHVVTPDTAPSVFGFLPGYADIVAANVETEMAKGLISNCDLLFCLDYNQLHRVDRLASAVEAAKARKVVVDHHLDVTIAADLIFSRPLKSSTCLILYHLLHQLELDAKLGVEGGTCIMTGLITDTGNFAHNSLDPQLYVAVAELVAMGVDKDFINREVFKTFSLSKLKLNVYALDQKMVLYPSYGGALLTLDQSELRRFDYQKGDTEGLVNVPLGLPGVSVSVFMRQEAVESKIKVSVRSLGDYPANEFCSRFFDGGGHSNAAGGEFVGTFDEAVRRVEEAMAFFADRLS